MAAVTTYRNEAHQKFAQVTLDNGEQVTLRLDQTGLVIERLTSADSAAERLFKGDTDQATTIALALLKPGSIDRGKVLDVLVAAVMRLGASDRIKGAFQAASRAIS